MCFLISSSRATKVSNWLEAAFINDVRRMRSYDQLTTEQQTFVGQNVADLANEHLLQLCMKMRFRLLNNNQMKGRTVNFLVSPPLMEIEDLDHHVDQIFETEAVVFVGQSQILLRGYSSVW